MISNPPAATEAPLHIGQVTLAVKDIARVSAFYDDVVGLERLAQERERVALGAGGRVLLVLESRPSAAAESGREPGLFHTAFLLPAREHLGRWLRNALDRGLTLTGASDHKVSEALYLDDPEGNGIEIYADRPPAEWRRENGEYVMTTDRLDLADLLEAGGRLGSGAPQRVAEMRIGHIHLRVGDLAGVQQFYRDGLGLDITHRRPGALWLGSGGYHHHVAANTWRSARSGPRRGGTAGLAGFRIAASSDEALGAAVERLRRSYDVKPGPEGSFAATDPAGIPVILGRAAA